MKLYACKDAIARMVDAEEGALSGADLARFRVHMTICPSCRACRRQVETMKAIVRELPPEAPPPATEEAALAAFRRREKNAT